MDCGQQRSMQLALPARCYHNPNLSPSSFHIRNAKSEAVYKIMHDQRLIAMIKLAKSSSRSFSSAMMANLSPLSTICISHNGSSWN